MKRTKAKTFPETKIKFSHLLLASLQHPIPYPRNPTKAKLTQSRTPVPEPEGEDEQEAKKNAWLSLRTDNRGDRKKEWLGSMCLPTHY